MQSSQMPLPFERFDRYDLESFLPGDNSDAISHLVRVIRGEEFNNLYLWGKMGTGKSHLLQAACTTATDNQKRTAYIPMSQRQELSPDMLEGLEQLDLVCIDDLECITGDDEWELSLFHLFNRMRESRHPLIMTADQSPQSLGMDLPDLKSRLGWDLVYRLETLDEASVILAMKRRAEQRRFELPDDVLDYMMKRVSRDTHSLFKLLDEIDAASISQKKKITIPFVKSLFIG